jgi:hypothetical protein
LIRWKKGQVWSYDLIIASIIFVLAMAVLSFFWWSIRTNMSENKAAIVRESLTISDVLMSPGIPENWNVGVDPNDPSTWSNVQQLGLAKSWDNKSLSVDKVYKMTIMSALNYSFVQNEIRSHYNFYVNVTFRNTSNGNLEQPVLLNGTTTPITMGNMYNLITVKTIAMDDRIAVYNNSIVIIRLYLWSDSTLD